jgi:hypothetical protein
VAEEAAGLGEGGGEGVVVVGVSEPFPSCTALIVEDLAAQVVDGCFAAAS